MCVRGVCQFVCVNVCGKGGLCVCVCVCVCVVVVVEPCAVSIYVYVGVMKCVRYMSVFEGVGI